MTQTVKMNRKYPYFWKMFWAALPQMRQRRPIIFEGVIVGIL